MLHPHHEPNGPACLTFLESAGPFFRLTVLPQATPGWRNLGADLRDATVLDRWVRDLQERFATGLGVPPAEINERAVRSTLHLGLVSRLISPWIGAALSTPRFPLPSLHELWWKPDGTTQFPLAVHDAAWANGPHLALAQQLRASVLEPLNALPLLTSLPVLWGNAVSGINGAITAISVTRADLTGPATTLGGDLIASLPAGQFTGELGQPTFRRRSCCLINSLTPQTREAICGDCIHTAAPHS